MPGLQLILASASPRRRDLLRQVGLEFSVEAPEVDESLDSTATAPAATVENLSRLKAQAIAANHSGEEALVLGSDTLVFLQERALGKPTSADETRSFLRALSGRTHHVYSGLCLLHAASGRQEVGHSRTAVRMRQLNDADIDDYLAAGESGDKAGGYAIQSRGAFLIEEIQGDYSNVVGLPLALLYEMLQRFGIRPLNSRLAR